MTYWFWIFQKGLILISLTSTFLFPSFSPFHFFSLFLLPTSFYFNFWNWKNILLSYFIAFDINQYYLVQFSTELDLTFAILKITSIELKNPFFLCAKKTSKFIQLVIFMSKENVNVIWLDNPWLFSHQKKKKLKYLVINSDVFVLHLLLDNYF